MNYRFHPVLLACIFLLSIACAGAKHPAIAHMRFCDVTNMNYAVGDTAHLYPFKEVSLYFFVDATQASDISDTLLLGYMAKDSFIQRQISSQPSRLSITFYKKSTQTLSLMEKKVSKDLSLCNDDIVVEYNWDDGKPAETHYYKNGKIIGSDEIKLKTLPR